MPCDAAPVVLRPSDSSPPQGMAMDFFRQKNKKPNLKSYERPETSIGPYGNQTEYILAFRTITSMLSMIQSPEVTNTEPTQQLTVPQCKELRVLDSLASLATRGHEIVATATALPNSSSGANVQVILSIVNLIDSEPALTSPQNSEKTWVRWFLTMNARRDPLKFPPTAQDEMELKDPDTYISPTLKELKSEEPSKSSNKKLLHTYLLTEW